MALCEEVLCTWPKLHGLLCGIVLCVYLRTSHCTVSRPSLSQMSTRDYFIFNDTSELNAWHLFSKHKSVCHVNKSSSNDDDWWCHCLSEDNLLGVEGMDWVVDIVGGPSVMSGCVEWAPSPGVLLLTEHRCLIGGLRGPEPGHLFLLSASDRCTNTVRSVRSEK